MGRLREIRRRTARAAWLTGSLGTLVGLWARLCLATTRWERHGEAEMARALATGPIVLVLWHERLMMAGAHWPEAWGRAAAPHTPAPIGRVAGAAQAHVGFDPIPMATRQSNLAASREILRRVRAGSSVAITGDGPRGPARRLKGAPLEWARATGRPVFVYAWAQSRPRRVASWDRMAWPVPFRRGAAVWRPWRDAVARRGTPEEAEALRLDLQRALDAVTAEAEALVTGPPSRAG
jgi:lysophospholipid acyltransferase (LPLAT)-like uncharacterized protein